MSEYDVIKSRLINAHNYLIKHSHPEMVFEDDNTTLFLEAATAIDDLENKVDDLLDERKVLTDDLYKARSYLNEALPYIGPPVASELSEEIEVSELCYKIEAFITQDEPEDDDKPSTNTLRNQISKVISDMMGPTRSDYCGPVTLADAILAIVPNINSDPKQSAEDVMKRYPKIMKRLKDG